MGRELETSEVQREPALSKLGSVADLVDLLEEEVGGGEGVGFFEEEVVRVGWGGVEEGRGGVGVEELEERDDEPK